MSRLLKGNIVILIIFLFVFFLRVWKVPELFFFGIDEEYQSLLALSIIKDFHLIWIGLSAASTGFYIGPGLVYLHSFLLWIGRLDPVILAYSSSVISIITCLIFYLIIKTFFNRKTALISTLLYSFSSFVIYYDRRFWNSTFVPAITILLFLSIIKSAKNPKWYISIAILLGISFHIHASLFIFIPIIIFTFINRLIKSHQKIPLTIYAVSIVTFILLYSPLIIFDLNHNFDNLKTPIRMLAEIGDSASVSILERFQVIQKTLSRFWFNEPLPSVLTQVLGIFSFAILIRFLMKRKDEKEGMIAIVLVFYFLSFVFFPSSLLDYYFLGFFPFFALTLGILLKKISWQYLVPIISIFVFLNCMVVFNWPSEKGLLAKKTLIKKTVNTLKDNSFRLETMEPYLYHGGWRYLFEAYGKRPHSSNADSMFGWIYPNEISRDTPNFKVRVTETNNLYQVTVLKND